MTTAEHAPEPGIESAAESLPRWDRIVETVRANQEAWKESAPDA